MIPGRIRPWAILWSGLLGGMLALEGYGILAGLWRPILATHMVAPYLFYCSVALWCIPSVLAGISAYEHLA